MPDTRTRRVGQTIAATAGALAILLCVAAQSVPSTSAGYLASVNNSTNNAATATYFQCIPAVTADAASALFAYSLGEATAATTAVDYLPTASNGTYNGSMVSDTVGAKACPRDPGGSYVLNGTTSYLTNPVSRTGTNVFTIEVWFKTTAAGGKLIGYGNAATGASSNYDRHLYINSAGRVVFGVYPGAVKTVISPLAYNNGAWHQAVATLSAAGMALYVDGALVGSDATVTTAQTYNGFWRIGYDNLNGWTGAPSNYFFSGSMRFAAVYSTALSAAKVKTHWAAGQ